MNSPSAAPNDSTIRSSRLDARLAKRHRSEWRFRAYGLAAISTALVILGMLFGSLLASGTGAFFESVAMLEIRFDPELIDPDGTGSVESLGAGDYSAVVRATLQRHFPEVTDRKGKRALDRLLSSGAAYDLLDRVLAEPSLVGGSAVVELPLSDDADLYIEGEISKDTPEVDRRLSDAQIAWLDEWSEAGLIRTAFNADFLTTGDSREPELAGIAGALVGTLLTLLVTLLSCFPLGVACAVYLEEFAPESRFTSLVEININNLAAVPSIIFGVLGLAIFLGSFGMTRSVPLVGGLVLALRTLPIIIISARAALAAVPPSIRQAAMGIGASPLQVVSHHVLPMAMPGILTGTIIGMAQALGETAPLLMIGMVAFVRDIPTGFDSPATVLPVQIYLWADAAERAFVEKTAGAILVLLGFLVSMNGLAVWMRQRFEQRL